MVKGQTKHTGREVKYKGKTNRLSIVTCRLSGVNRLGMSLLLYDIHSSISIKLSLTNLLLSGTRMAVAGNRNNMSQRN
jgi:hypothetical protein